MFKKLLIILCIVYGILIGSAYTKTSQQANKICKGKLSASLYINGKSVELGNNSLLLYEHYLLEPTYTITEYTVKNPIKNTQKSTSSTRIDHYQLIDLKDSITYIFSPDINKPQLISKMPLSKKVKGFDFNSGKKSFITPYVSMLQKSGDSTYNAKHYVLLSLKSDMIVQRRGLRNIKIVINKNLAGLPLHFMSHKLEEQYGGSIEQVFVVDTAGQTLKQEFIFNEGLLKADELTIKRFINKVN